MSNRTTQQMASIQPPPQSAGGYSRVQKQNLEIKNENIDEGRAIPEEGASRQRFFARSMQQSPTNDNQQASSQIVTNEQFYRLVQEHNANIFDEAIIQKLEASPYRQKLYFKKVYTKSNGGHQRAPSVQLATGNGVIYNNSMFPPAEYFQNMKSIQMRHTQQEGGFKKMNAPRSNSILGQRVKQLNGIATPPKITSIQGQQSMLPQSIIPMKQQQYSTIYSSLNTSQQDLPQNGADQDYTQSKQLSSRGIRFYNRVVEKFENKFYLKKTRPSSLKKEEIYDENLQLKHQLNQLREHLTLQKTQNKLLNNELEKQNNLMMQVIGQGAPLMSGESIVIQDGTVKQSELVVNLKRELDKALKDLSEKETEIKTIQKQSKITKYKELEEECKMYMNECFRLHRVLKKFLIQTGMSKNLDSQPNLDIPQHDLQQAIQPDDKLGFIKNQNTKLSEEVKAYKQRFDIQAQQIKTLKDSLQQSLGTNDQVKPLHDHIKMLQGEIEKLKTAPPNPIVVAKESAQLGSVKDDPKFKALKIASEKLEQELIVLRQQNEKVKDQLQDAESMTDSLQTQLVQLRLDHQAENKKASENTVKLDQQIQSLQTQLNNSLTQYQQLQSQFTSYQNSQSQSKTAKEAELLKLKDQLEGNVSNLKKELATVQFEKLKLKTEGETKLQELKDQYEQKLVTHLTETNQKDLKLVQLQQKFDQLHSSSDKSSEISDLRLQLSAKDEKLKTLQDALDIQTQQISLSQIEYLKMKANIELYTSEVSILKAQQSDQSQIQELERLTKLNKEQTAEVKNLQNECSKLREEKQKIQKAYSEDRARIEEQKKEVYQMKEKEMEGVRVEIEEKDKEILRLQQQLKSLDGEASLQIKEDAELMTKLEQLMVSLQLKDKDMQAQAASLQTLTAQLSDQSLEIDSLGQQLNDKDAEIFTLKNYFEKSQNEIEKLEKELKELKQQASNLVPKHQQQQQEISNQDMEKDSEMRKELEKLKEELENERKNRVVDIEMRFRRCLEILQINEVKGLNTFFKSALTEKSGEEEDLNEFVSMKFNMNITESTLFLQKVLKLTGKFSKNDVIERFIEKVGKNVVLLEKAKVMQGYQELASHIIAKYQTVEKYLSEQNFDQTRVIHFYLVEKMLKKLLSQSTLPQGHFKKEELVNMLITHLLSQSRNFYQIETRILKEYLLKQQVATKTTKQKEEQKLESKVSPRKEKPADQKKEPEQEEGEEEEEEDEYEYYEELDEEERQLMQEEEKKKDETFGKAIKKMQAGTSRSEENSKDTAPPSIQLNTENQIESARSNSKKAATKKKIPSTEGEKILHQIASFLVQRKINLRQFLKVYHVDPKDLAFQTQEIEALKLDEFLAFIKQQNIFNTQDDLELEAQFEEDIEKALKTTCLLEVESLDLKVIDHSKLVEQLGQFEYQDFQRPKVLKNFDVSTLDLKSIRIINRLSQKVYKEVEKFINTNHLNVQLSKEQSAKLLEQIVENMFKTVIKRIMVHTNQQDEKVYLIQMEEFYKHLVEIGIRKKSDPLPHLSQFLQLNAQYSHYVYMKKVTKLVEMFNKHSIFNAIGTKKILLQEKKEKPANKVQIITEPKIQEEEIKKEEKAPAEVEDEYEYGYEEYGEEEKEQKSPGHASPVVKKPVIEAKPTPQVAQKVDLFAPEPPKPIAEPQKEAAELDLEEYYEYYEEVESPKK